MDKNPSFKHRRYATVAKTAASGFSKKASQSGGVSDAQFSDFYSPVLSKDFLELPQNLKERRLGTVSFILLMKWFVDPLIYTVSYLFLVYASLPLNVMIKTKLNIF